MKVQVGFSTTNSIPSRLIRWFLGSEVSHTYLRFYDEFLQTHLVIHADWPGVVIDHWDLFKIQNIVVEEYTIQDPKLKPALIQNLRHLRKKYPYWALPNWAWAITFKRWVKKKVQNPTKNPSRMICVDLLLHILNMAEITDMALNEHHPVSFRQFFSDNWEAKGWIRTVYEVKK